MTAQPEDSDGEGYTRSPGTGVTWSGVPPYITEVRTPLIAEDDLGIIIGEDQDGQPVRMQLRLFHDEAALLLGSNPWHAEFAHVRAPSWRDEGQEEDVAPQRHEGPSFGVGDQVVFRDSDPATRRVWTVAEFDPAHSFGAWPSAPPTTCTVRRGSTVKRGVSFGRLELAPPE